MRASPEWTRQTFVPEGLGRPGSSTSAWGASIRGGGLLGTSSHRSLTLRDSVLIPHPQEPHSNSFAPRLRTATLSKRWGEEFCATSASGKSARVLKGLGVSYDSGRRGPLEKGPCARGEAAPGGLGVPGCRLSERGWREFPPVCSEGLMVISTEGLHCGRSN